MHLAKDGVVIAGVRTSLVGYSVADDDTVWLSRRSPDNIQIIGTSLIHFQR